MQRNWFPAIVLVLLRPVHYTNSLGFTIPLGLTKNNFFPAWKTHAPALHQAWAQKMRFYFLPLFPFAADVLLLVTFMKHNRLTGASMLVTEETEKQRKKVRAATLQASVALSQVVRNGGFSLSYFVNETTCAFSTVYFFLYEKRINIY